MRNDNKYIPHVESFSNTKEFTYLADYFTKNGYYCNIPEEKEEYKEFWKDVKAKCMFGMENSVGQKITGDNFFYLNFCPILSQSEDEETKRKKKSFNFPRFVDLDYEYFWMIDYCKLNEKGLEAVKGRRQGWSYKGAAIVTKEYTFLKESRSIIGAFLSTYSQGTMNMVIGYLNHISSYTPFGHIRNPDLKDYFMSQHQKDIGGVKVWSGYKSSVEVFTFKDRPAVAAGKSASIILLDEAGLFPNITESWGFTEPLIKDGSSFTGVAIIYGSAGDMDSGSKYFYEMFTNPRKYNMLEFQDPEDPTKIIGFFSSSTKGRWGVCKDPNSKWYQQPMVDDNGNSNEEAAYDDIIYYREQAKGGLDSRAFHLAVTQFPTTWKEAFLRNKGAVFASHEMLEWLSTLETTSYLRDDKKKVELYFDHDNKIKAKLNPDLQDITNYPLGSDESKKGCITVWEDPIENPPYGLYILGIDPFDQDKAESSDSLGSCVVYKRFLHNGTSYDTIVAEYTGRPDKADEFYETCRRLCVYYNGKALYENQLKGLKAYFEMKNSLHYLCEQPQIIKDIVKDSKVNRGYGIHMNRGTGSATGIKDQCEIYVHQWLYEERTGPDDTKILNLHTIKSIGLLKELIAYDRECNTDRVVAFMLCILQAKEMHKLQLLELQPKTMLESESFFSKRLFQKNTYNKIKY
jgi:hypothetical protein